MNKTTEALKLAEALENDAKEHREVSYGLDCPPECTANWKHALNCEAAARLIREALAEPVKQEPVAIVDEIGKRLDGTYIFNAVGKVDVGQPLYAAPVSAKCEWVDLLAAFESVWLWMENQADGQSKGGHATFDLMMLREQRDIAHAAISKFKSKNFPPVVPQSVSGLSLRMMN